MREGGGGTEGTTLSFTGGACYLHGTCSHFHTFIPHRILEQLRGELQSCTLNLTGGYANFTAPLNAPPTALGTPFTSSSAAAAARGTHAAAVHPMTAGMPLSQVQLPGDGGVNGGSEGRQPGDRFDGDGRAAAGAAASEMGRGENARLSAGSGIVPVTPLGAAGAPLTPSCGSGPAGGSGSRSDGRPASVGAAGVSAAAIAGGAAGSRSAFSMGGGGGASRRSTASGGPSRSTVSGGASLSSEDDTINCRNQHHKKGKRGFRGCPRLFETTLITRRFNAATLASSLSNAAPMIHAQSQSSFYLYYPFSPVPSLHRQVATTRQVP